MMSLYVHVYQYDDYDDENCKKTITITDYVNNNNFFSSLNHMQ